MREVEIWQKRLVMKRISLIAIIVCFILSLLILLLTIYGSNVGNFVVKVEEEKLLSISLSENKEFSNPSTTLMALGVNNMTDATFYQNIPSNIADTDGSHNDDVYKRYFAYTFYLKNTSPIAINYNMELNITSVSKNVDSALRVLLITDDKQTIYAKENSSGYVETSGGYMTTPFYSTTSICHTSTSNFSSDEVVKYTVVFWLEGYDEDCVDAIKGGHIKMEMRFAAM